MVTDNREYVRNSVLGAFGFFVPPGQSILFVGSDADAMEELPFLAACATTIIPATAPADLHGMEGTFDYVILRQGLDACPDPGMFLDRLRTFCAPQTRVIVCGRNRAWGLISSALQPASAQTDAGRATRPSMRDTRQAMAASGFQLTRSRRAMICPAYALGMGPVINSASRWLPFLGPLKSHWFQVYRPAPGPEPWPRESLTVCLVCRDERDNIEPLVRAIPKLADEQEILFVEGHSRDGTRAEIERCIARYPEKNIRVIGQPGNGKADAVLAGFTMAQGNVIIMLEADMTSPPAEIRRIYDRICRRQAEFISGSRFARAMPTDAMPLLNRLGNRLFAIWFSALLRQRISDALCGIKAIRKSDFDRIAIRWGQWGANDPFGDFELLLGAAQLGLMIDEQPIRYGPRFYGVSKTRVFQHGAVLSRMALGALSRFRA